VYKPTERPTKQISVRLQVDEAVKVERLATAEGRSVTNYVRRVLLDHLEEVKG